MLVQTLEVSIDESNRFWNRNRWQGETNKFLFFFPGDSSGLEV